MKNLASANEWKLVGKQKQGGFVGTKMSEIYFTGGSRKDLRNPILDFNFKCYPAVIFTKYFLLLLNLRSKFNF